MVRRPTFGGTGAHFSPHESRAARRVDRRGRAAAPRLFARSLLLRRKPIKRPYHSGPHCHAFFGGTMLQAPVLASNPPPPSADVLAHAELLAGESFNARVAEEMPARAEGGWRDLGFGACRRSRLECALFMERAGRSLPHEVQPLPVVVHMKTKLPFSPVGMVDVPATPSPPHDRFDSELFPTGWTPVSWPQW